MKKSSFYHTPLHSTPPLGGFPSEYRYPLWCGKTTMVSLPDVEKISKIFLFVMAQLTNVTDGRTLHDSKDRAYASHRAVKIAFFAFWRQTYRQTDEQMDSTDALSHSRCRERRLNKSNKSDPSLIMYGTNNNQFKLHLITQFFMKGDQTGNQSEL